MFELNLLRNIERINGWTEVRQLLVLSKRTRNYILQPAILIEAIEYHIKNKEHMTKLPKWVHLPILENHKIIDNLGFIPQDNTFITGGYITQKIFNLEWESDIDIWHKDTYDHRIQVQLGDKTIDNVYTIYDPQLCIADFDLSICQVGILVRDGTKYYYYTPLFLYSQHTKNIVINIRPIYMNYVQPKADEWYRLDILTLYKFHLNHKTYEFHNCRHCHDIMDSKYQYDNVQNYIVRWWSRINKYLQRFDQFYANIIYAPADPQHYKYL